MALARRDRYGVAALHASSLKGMAAYAHHAMRLGLRGRDGERVVLAGTRP